MFHFSGRTPIYIQLYFNRVAITNLDTGELIEKESAYPFSNSRIIIADFNIAEQLIRDTLKGFSNYRKFPAPSYKAVIQQMAALEGGLSAIEIRALRDLAEMSGSAWVKIIEHANPLSREQALAELKSER